jgi:hypothetical protein
MKTTHFRTKAKIINKGLPTCLEQGLQFSLRVLLFVFIGTWVLEGREDGKGELCV